MPQNKGAIPWNKGTKGVCKANSGCFKKGDNTGEDNCNYKGGISKVDKLIRRMPEYLQWRSDIFQRDNWTCKTCNVNNVYVTVHHIKSVRDIILDNNIKTTNDARNCSELWDENNGVTLCECCHSLTDNYKGRAIKNI